MEQTNKEAEQPVNYTFQHFASHTHANCCCAQELYDSEVVSTDGVSVDGGDDSAISEYEVEAAGPPRVSRTGA